MRKPKVVICRHAESVEDVDKTIYDRIPDLQVPLTQTGRVQAGALGNELADILSDSAGVSFFSSPGLRNVQTLEVVLPLLPKQLRISVYVDPLMVKQDWGYITADNRPGIEADRYATGVLRYNFPTGERADSLLERFSVFAQKIHKTQAETGDDLVLLSHGFEFRVLLMIMLGWTEEEFESYGNLRNCEYRILTALGNQRYDLNKSLIKHGNPISRLQSKSLSQQ